MDTSIIAVSLAFVGFVFYGIQRHLDQKRYNALVTQVLAKARENDGEGEPEDNQTTKALYHLIGTLQGQNLSKDQLIADLLREKREMITKIEGKDRQINSLRLDMANCQEMIAKLGKFDDSTLP